MGSASIGQAYEHCERLLRGRCCRSRGGRSARHKLWARLLELRRSDPVEKSSHG